GKSDANASSQMQVKPKGVDTNVSSEDQNNPSRKSKRLQAVSKSKGLKELFAKYRQQRSSKINKSLDAQNHELPFDDISSDSYRNDELDHSSTEISHPSTEGEFPTNGFHFPLGLFPVATEFFANVDTNDQPVSTTDSQEGLCSRASSSSGRGSIDDLSITDTRKYQISKSTNIAKLRKTISKNRQKAARIKALRSRASLSSGRGSIDV